MPEKKKTPWYIAGLNFDCLQCSACCSGPDAGYIWVTRNEVQLIADFLKIDPGQLRKKYLKRIGMRTTIIEHPKTKDCIFLQKAGDSKQCAIYPVRPNQCRTWPFWTSNLVSPNDWNNTAQKCSGINRGPFYSFERIEKIRKQKKWW